LISKPFITNNLFLGRLKISACDFTRDYVRKGSGGKWRRSCCCWAMLLQSIW